MRARNIGKAPEEARGAEAAQARTYAWLRCFRNASVIGRQIILA